MPVITYLEAIRQALFEEMARDERVFILGEDIGAAEGYGSMEDAKAALAEMKDEKNCEGVVVGG